MPTGGHWDAVSPIDDDDYVSVPGKVVGYLAQVRLPLDDPERSSMLTALCKELPKLPTGALAEVLGYVQETADYWAERERVASANKE